MKPEHVGSVVARVLEQCKRPNAWALEHAGSLEEFDSINLAMDACGVPDAPRISTRGVCYVPANLHSYMNWLDAEERSNRPCTSPRRGLCRAGLAFRDSDKARWRWRYAGLMLSHSPSSIVISCRDGSAW